MLQANELTTAKNNYLIAASTITDFRKNMGHPEDICEKHFERWNVLSTFCRTIEELSTNFEIWKAEIESYDARINGKLH